jgi:hypothetical protein
MVTKDPAIYYQLSNADEPVMNYLKNRIELEMRKEIKNLTY